MVSQPACGLPFAGYAAVLGAYRPAQRIPCPRRREEAGRGGEDQRPSADAPPGHSPGAFGVPSALSGGSRRRLTALPLKKLAQRVLLVVSVFRSRLM